MVSTKADTGRRLVAALIDAIIASIPAAVLPLIGIFITVAYMLTKDAAIYELTKNEEYKNRSIGKKIMNLAIVVEGEKYVTWQVSIRRNLTLSLGSIIAIVPIVGWIIGAIVGTILFIVELLRVLIDPNARRFGDDFAHTQVVDVPATNS